MKRKNKLSLIFAVLIAMPMTTGCSLVNRGKKSGFNFSVQGNAAGVAHPDNKWRAKHLLDEAHACMRKVSGESLKYPKGKFVLVLVHPVGWSNGFPEIERREGRRIYGLAWRAGGVFYYKLAIQNDGHPNVPVQKHEAGHWVEFANNKPAHWQRVASCFSGTFWRNAAVRVTNLNPGPDKPIINANDLQRTQDFKHRWEEIDADGDGKTELVLVTYLDE